MRENLFFTLKKKVFGLKFISLARTMGSEYIRFVGRYKTILKLCSDLHECQTFEFFIGTDVKNRFQLRTRFKQ